MCRESWEFGTPGGRLWPDYLRSPDSNAGIIKLTQFKREAAKRRVPGRLDQDYWLIRIH